ncbi:MAG: TaqI-like C-terminal specificity domain-containing protein [Pseudomonadota bacterium]
MSIPDSVKDLIETFDNNVESYKKGKYNETQVRREFIDPFFEALGWDIPNKKGHAEAYKDVIHEDAIKVGGVTKAPDYCFRIGGVRKFFLEAKKPAVNIQTDIHAAYQLRRYGWSAKLPLSILTDFEEFAVYDCRVKPGKSDKGSHSRILYCKYTDYEERWEEIAGIFSKDAIQKGSFDKYVESKKGKRGTTEVDAAFLNEIEAWRSILAKDIARRNMHLSQRELNFAVQKTIDRIVFLRICEDRGMERYGKLRALCGGKGVYSKLVNLFKDADAKYNSGLFHFKKEKGRENYDSLTPSLIIGDDSLSGIFKNLYYPESPYEFSVLSADILGQVYERFLGKIIRLTPKHQAKIEEKPQVRKAGGVYYTPTYVVDHIVENTVAKLVEGKKPGSKGGVKDLKILDPACGSGSFLIGVYQFLLDWHLSAYTKDGPEKWSKGKDPRLCQSKRGEWRLTTDERKRILLNNIFGVDIDHQAVEVTKLSLLLKVLEGENEQSIGKQMRLIQERVLPDLANNIKCGNSLISPDFYNNQQLNLLDDEALYKVNVFDWDTEFPEIMKNGGFNAVVGNPPYIQLSMEDYYDEPIGRYLENMYSSSMGRLNTFGLFIEKTLHWLLAKNGYFSFIVPNTILTQEYYQKLRTMILNYKIIEIVNYKYPVFKGAVVETIVFNVLNSSPGKHEVEIINFDNKEMKPATHRISQWAFLSTHKNAFLVTADDSELEFQRTINETGTPLGKIANINQAIALKKDRKSSIFDKKLANNYKPFLDGRNINRYRLDWGGQYLAYDVEKIHSCKRTDIFEAKEKLLFRRVSDHLIATYDDKQFYALNTLVVITLRQQGKLSMKYLLALINSQLLNLYYVKYLKSTKKIFSEIQARQLAQLPIRIIDFDDPEDVMLHDNLVMLVDRMLGLNVKLDESKTSQEKEMAKRQIEATDKQINDAVCKLYGVSAEDMRAVGVGE